MWLRGKLRLRCGEGRGRDELFSEHHARGCQIAFLHTAAFLRTGLDRFGFVHMDGLLPPLQMLVVHAQPCGRAPTTPKPVPGTCGVLCTGWLRPRARAAA